MICQPKLSGLRYVLLALVYPMLTSCKFLATKGLDDLSSDMADTKESNLLNELEAAVGRDHRVATERRVRRLEDAMRPTFNSLPKEDSGRLGATAVRYMLNRLFVTRHGWFFHGLRNSGEGWNETTPTDVLGKHTTPDVQNIFEKQLDTHGFDLHHAAVLAATLENFVHTESVERLTAVYEHLDVALNSTNISDAQVSRIMQTYAMLFVLRRDHTTVTRAWIQSVYAKASTIYPGWGRTMAFLDEIREAVLEDEDRYDRLSEDAPDTSNSWNTTLKILERFGEQYGRWQNHECVDMKKKLLELETPGTGRVPLTRFYGASATDPTKWHFRENADYLRILGALDESDPNEISVVIPNYINGASNCVAGSKSYDVCCIDECDTLMSHIEERIVASEVSPKRILEVVAQLPSDSVQAPREIPDTLAQRLEEIASHHGGLVPLHGRLFAQWMHHAYPRECSFPHLSGVATFMTPKSFENKTGKNSGLKPYELHQAGKAQSETSQDSTDELPWFTEEELLAPKTMSKKAPAESSRFPILKRLVLLLASGLSICAMLYRTLTTLNPTSKAVALSMDNSNHKYLV